MLVYIATTGDGFYLVDAYGNVAASVWFSHLDDCVEYCNTNAYRIAEG